MYVTCPYAVQLHINLKGYTVYLIHKSIEEVFTFFSRDTLFNFKKYQKSCKNILPIYSTPYVNSITFKNRSVWLPDCLMLEFIAFPVIIRSIFPSSPIMYQQDGILCVSFILFRIDMRCVASYQTNNLLRLNLFFNYISNFFFSIQWVINVQIISVEK